MSLATVTLCLPSPRATYHICSFALASLNGNSSGQFVEKLIAGCPRQCMRWATIRAAPSDIRSERKSMCLTCRLKLDIDDGAEAPPPIRKTTPETL